MEICLIVIALAFFWLLYETRYLTIRLETTEYQRTKQVKVKSELVTYPELRTREVDQMETKIPYKPTEFTPLDMPETNGKLNIVCARE